jgi:hypothetical protein
MARTNWDETTPISEGNLNNIEDRIDQAEANIVTGKTAFASALVTKGQTANVNNTYAELAQKCLDIVKAGDAGKIAKGQTLGAVAGAFTDTLEAFGYALRYASTCDDPLASSLAIISCFGFGRGFDGLNGLFLAFKLDLSLFFCSIEHFALFLTQVILNPII